jgi:hypothetical protein
MSMKIKSLMAVFLISGFFGCNSYYYSIKSDVPKSLGLNNYKVINLGWVDLNENMWKELGYDEANKNDWINLVQDFNKSTLAGYLKGYYKDKEINPPASKNEISKKAGLNITFTSVKFIRGGFQNAALLRGQGKYPIDHIETVIHFTDNSTGKEIYKADVIAYAYGAVSGFVLEMNVNYCAGNLAMLLNKIIGY